MKSNGKRVSAVLSLVTAVVMLAGCSGGVRVLGENETDVTAKVGESFSLNLAENQTTGYSWATTISDESVVKLSDDQYVTDENPDGKVGVGGTRTLTFTALAAGTATITLSYERSFEADSATETRTLTVTVS
ncbi:MAG: protease inhibitor I42 family protein [Propionibacteriaceae bacterium]|jgi:inhibitor of cysteine peptidase|nr:protease inhibitor I42 family protein [Propionibacteriaceae bacterium]